ncbi:hypothetical protein QJS10_CPA07g01192 [Acorus calamus]|uniref:Glyoxalase At5g48480-like N-terminal domain-containing protein n=1 Tax=Acorus calamus TaxID=4465 RepID=A0AAV9EFI4_ACOCL|nr:hypothetical protein QJS10_CPA07g01192 [Acorus calamus]
MGEGGERPKMGVMVMPGFMIGATVIQSQCIPMRDIEDYEYANYNHVPYDLGISELLFLSLLSLFAASDVERLRAESLRRRSCCGVGETRLMVVEGKADETVKFYKAAFGAEELNKISYPKKEGGPGAPSHICADFK